MREEIKKIIDNADKFRMVILDKLGTSYTYGDIVITRGCMVGREYVGVTILENLEHVNLLDDEEIELVKAFPRIEPDVQQHHLDKISKILG